MSERGMTEKQRQRITRDYGQMYVALRRIASYLTTERLRKEAGKLYGLEPDEAIEMAYENVIQEAKDGLKGIYKPQRLADKRASDTQGAVRCP